MQVLFDDLRQLLPRLEVRVRGRRALSRLNRQCGAPTRTTGKRPGRIAVPPDKISRKIRTAQKLVKLRRRAGRSQKSREALDLRLGEHRVRAREMLRTLAKRALNSRSRGKRNRLWKLVQEASHGPAYRFRAPARGISRRPRLPAGEHHHRSKLAADAGDLHHAVFRVARRPPSRSLARPRRP